MFLNIITPCSRPENLHIISESIKIPKTNYRWIIVFDMDSFPDDTLIPNNCEIHLHRNPKSIVGHSQMNFGIELVNDGYIYRNDDDTIIHPDLWENIKNLDQEFITFHQNLKSGEKRLYGEVAVTAIDSHNFIVKKDIISDIRFIIDKYDADGYFAVECFKNANTSIVIDKVLSIYNYLR